MTNPPLNLVFEPVEFCPLQCPSCPQGRREIAEMTGRPLKAAELSVMLARIAPQTQINKVNLFNWGEPMLSPVLPDLVRVAQPYGRVEISTTGNHVKCDLIDLARARPDKLTVATSGWTQAIYETTHPNGTVENFRRFCERLWQVRMPNVTVCFHRYQNNLHEEAAVRNFALNLGFRFHGGWAYHAPVEALIAGESNPFQVVKTPVQLDIARTQPEFTCGLMTSELKFNYRGDVTGCTAAKDQSAIGNVFEHSIADLLERKRRFSLCTACYRAGAYKICCGSNTAVDREAARISPGNGLRYAWERFKKPIWQTWELRKVSQ